MGDAERPELAHELVDGRGQRVGIGHVGLPGCGAPAHRRHLLDQRVETDAVKADRCDVGPLARGA